MNRRSGSTGFRPALPNRPIPDRPSRRSSGSSRAPDPQARRDALIGWRYSPFRTDDLMAGIRRTWQRKEGACIGLRIFDATGPKGSIDGTSINTGATIVNSSTRLRPCG